MQITLRRQIVLTLVPMFVVLAALGGAGLALLYQVGSRIDAILRENYRSVIYMERLNEALERIDSSFNFAIAGREDMARKQYATNWTIFRDNLKMEKENITLPGEAELADSLEISTNRYQSMGDTFFSKSSVGAARVQAYHDPGGLFDLFKEIKTTSSRILRMNQENMEHASREAQRTAVVALALFGASLGLAAVLSVLLTWRMVHKILQPIRAVTHSAQGISDGNLDQVVPVLSQDELGQLANAFNRMARHLRDYRQSQTAELLRAQRTSQATIDSFPDPVLVIDGEGNVEMANPAAWNLLGVTSRPKGEPPVGPWQPPDVLRKPLAEALQGVRDYLPEGFDQTILFGSNGSERALLPRILTIRDPEDHTLGAAVLLQDVTRLRLLDEVKSNLVATASHELKTPLTSIRLALHLLLEEAIGPLNAKQTELLLDARDNSERLLTMVNNLLDLARLEQDWRQLDAQPQAPSALLRSAAEAIRAEAQDKGVDLVVEPSPDLSPVVVDVERMGHALRNLLNNALTHTDRGGHITLSAAPNGDAIQLSIADTGSGIPAEYLTRIFEKFFRVPGESRGGAGLGLAIVHEIVAAHGGTITCESELGKGTVFHIRLPRQAAPAANNGESPA